MTTWKKQTLAEVLATTANAHAQDEALVISGKRLTYAELRDNVRELAQGLRALGINHGDHVAVCMGNSLEWVIFFYAAASIGAVTVPVNTRFKADEMLYCLKQADVKLLFVTDRFLNIDFIAMLRSLCPAVDNTLPDAATEKPVDLGAVLQGSVGAISYMQTSCAACRQELLALKDLRGKYPELKVVAISVDSGNPARVARYREHFGFDFPFVHDPDFKTPELFGFSFTPALVLVAKDGTIGLLKGGYRPGDEVELERKILELTGKQ